MQLQCAAVCEELYVFWTAYMYNSRLESATGELEGGQPGHRESVGHLQPEKSVSGMGTLELEQDEAKQAKTRLKQVVTVPKEKQKNKWVLSLNTVQEVQAMFPVCIVVLSEAEQAEAKERLEVVMTLKKELEKKWVAIVVGQCETMS